MSDSDDALDIAGSELAALRNPYTHLTVDGNPLTPGLGYSLLYLPFGALGLSHVLSIAIVLLWLRGDPLVLGLLWLKIGITGSDYLSNAVLVAWCLAHFPPGLDSDSPPVRA